MRPCPRSRWRTDVVLVLLDAQRHHVLGLLQDTHGVLHGAVLQTHAVDGQQPVPGLQGPCSTHTHTHTGLYIYIENCKKKKYKYILEIYKYIIYTLEIYIYIYTLEIYIYIRNIYTLEIYIYKKYIYFLMHFCHNNNIQGVAVTMALTCVPCFLSGYQR